ncbi:hypothetical protein Pan216_37290 [Planctomycetes bacterium Pan216]|uniref:AhpC/TSA family protein n=1 Tax=Kolteria novifilia TaxID=2527975 RepID=A0A518B7B3_9BACT|nr:hypothetical protein Pan216_37290 [Planctomycetes bacterium Pan216]
MPASPTRSPAWMKTVLLAAAVYNLTWGIWVVMLPSQTFTLFGMQPPRYLELWQCLGMVVGVYGIGYAVAAYDPFRHWPIVLVGLLGKIFGTIGFIIAAVKGTLPIAMGATVLTNDLIWWVPFAVIVWEAFGEAMRPEQADERGLTRLESSTGTTLADLSDESPILVVFLRHFGCTFCREALADLAEKRAAIEGNGVRIAVVHMGSFDQGDMLLRRYGLGDVAHVSDPQCVLYRELGLERGRPGQLLGPRVLWRGFQAAIFHGHGIGRLVGDGLQMPGVFLIHRGDVVRSYHHGDASDRPDYAELAQCAVSAPVG